MPSSTPPGSTARESCHIESPVFWSNPDGATPSLERRLRRHVLSLLISTKSFFQSILNLTTSNADIWMVTNGTEVQLRPVLCIPTICDENPDCRVVLFCLVNLYSALSTLFHSHSSQSPIKRFCQ